MTGDELFESGTFDILFNKSATELGRYTKREYPQGTMIYDATQATSKIMFVRRGWIVTSKILPGGTRIVTDFIVNGDMLSTRAAELAQESIHALTDVVCYEFSDLHGGRELSAKLCNLVLLEMIRRQARMAERLANIGRRDGLERISHLLLELAIRARHAAKLNLDGFACPLRQADIGDATGLSTVHVNRVLKDMRLNGLLWFRNGVVEFPDRERLIDLVNFDAHYLYSRQ